MALTASFTTYPTQQSSPHFHVVVEFSQAILPTTLVATDFRVRRQDGVFQNPTLEDVDFYTDDNITFLCVFHMDDQITSSNLLYLVRLPMNRIQYLDENSDTVNGPDSTINTPQFNIEGGRQISGSITFSESEGEAGTATTATILFNQEVSGVTLDDFSVADGTLGSTLTEVNSGRYEVDVTPSASGDGTLTLTFAEDGTYEGNPEVTADLPYTGGGGIPTPANNAPSFGESSYSFSDIAIAVNTVVGSVVATDEDDDNISYSLTGADAANFAIDSNGQITVATALTNSSTYDFNVVADDETDTTSVAVTVTATAPPPPVTDAVLDITVNPGSVTAGGIATATFTFDKSVTGFTDADVSVSTGATKGVLTDEGNNVWTLPITAPSAGSGTVTVSVGADVVSPGNNADSVQFAYTAPPPPPVTDAVLDITVNPGSVTAGGIATATFTFDKPVSGFTDADVSVSAGATKGVLTDEGNNIWTLPVTAPSAGSGTVTVSVGSDVVSPGNNADSVQFAYTAPAPPPPQMAMTTGVPTGLKVELTPTTALLKWAAATDGGDADEYEVNVAEGASLGSTWIGTGSTGTRFFVKRLKRGTQYTFGVRGRNSEGAGDASRPVTQNTPIASLHNALFFKECVNYFDDGARVSVHGNPSELVRAVADNDYKTFTREKDLVINIAIGGNPTRVDAILVKGQDIEGHSAEPTGGTGSGYSNRMMPATVKNWEGTEVSTVVAGFQHDLYLLDSHFTATSVRMTFTGANAKITEIMLLEFGLEIDSNADFTQINPDFVDRTGVVHPDAGDGIAYSPSIGDGRDKWQVDYVVRVVPGKTLLETPEDFLYWRSDNRNHVHAMEPSRFPLRIFPSVFMRKSVPIRYRTDSKTSGEILSFRVAEQ